MSAKEIKDDKRNGSGPMTKPAETLTTEEVFARLKAQGGLILVKTIASELAAMVRAEVDAEIAAEKERAAKMRAYFDALGGEPPPDEAEQAAAKRKWATRPVPATEAEIVERAVEYIKARNAKNKPPEARGLSRWTGHDSAKVEALLADHAEVFKAADKKWHVRVPVQPST